jgi:hypothetical protein
MVCLRNISVDTLHKGDTDNDNDDNNNNNNNFIFVVCKGRTVHAGKILQHYLLII